MYNARREVPATHSMARTRRMTRPRTARPGGRAPRAIGPVPAPPPMWDDEEDYGSDECVGLGLSLAQRARCKLISVIHAGRVDASDEDFEWPLDQDHDIETVTTTLDAFADFLVELSEALVWHAEARGVAPDATDTLCHIYHTFSKQDASCASGSRNIGRVAVREIKAVLDEYVAVYELEEHRPALDTAVRVRRVRASSTQDRAGRFTQTRRTDGAGLVSLATELLRSVDAALVRCGETGEVVI
jgi:hypothetical protein